MSERFERIVLGLSVAVAAGYVGLYVVLSVQRVGYPFELEWMEGGSLEHLMRVLRGEPLYVTPSIDFVPFPYPPFYYYLAALVSKLTGAGFLPLRAISLASSLGTAVIVHLFVRRETGRAVYGLIAAGVFLGTWRASGLYFDIARLDSLFTFLLLASLYVLRFNSKPVDLVLAALLGGFAVMTKQTGAVVLAPVALWCALADWQAHGRDLARFREWSRFVLFGLPLAAFVGGGTGLLNGIVDENFLLHIVNAQQQHGILTRMIGFFFWNDLLGVLPLSVLLTLGWLWIVRSERREWDGFYGVVLVTVLLACLIPRIKVGGAANNLILAHAWLAVSMGVAIPRVRARLEERRPSLVAKLPGWLAVALLLQLLFLFRVPAGYLPSEADGEAGRVLAARIAQIDGEVLMPVQGYLAGRAGKRVYAHQMPASDYAKSGLAEAGPLLESYEQAVRERRFAAILDSNTAFLRGYLRDGLLEREYVRKSWLFQDPNVLLPISGAQIRAGTLWVPRD